VLAILAETEGEALSGRDLLRRLGLGRDRRADLAALLADLKAEGVIRPAKGGRFRLASERRLIVGRLSMHRDGYGFVEPEDRQGPDVYVRHRNLGGALHRDRVQVQVTAAKGGGRAEGRITRVLERSRHRLTGVLRARGDRVAVVPYGSEPYEEIAISGPLPAGGGDGVVVGVEVTTMRGEEGTPAGRIVEVLGPADEPGMDLRIIIRKYGLRDAFPDEVREAARAMPSEVSARDLEGREDFRSLPTVTIDGETARDFDDAISIRRTRGDGYTLWVHIADVSHYVREDSPIDREARERGTSVYFPERAIHMLPEELSTGICSLKPNVDRLCQTCRIELDRDGAILSFALSRGVIRSDRRMTYTEVARCLAGDEEMRRSCAAHAEDFAIMEELCAKLRRRRMARGSLDFDLPEPVIVLDDRGEMTGIRPLERNIAHQIIEEFMLVANECVATDLVDREWPALFRLHDKPDPVKLAELDSILRTFGLALPGSHEEITSGDIQALLRSVEGKPEAGALQRIVLRSMMRAHYSETFGLHFGLATRRYLHFTSPIRRYPDLVVHRTLTDRARWQRSSPEERSTRRKILHAWAEQSSERERNAEAAEWELIDWKKVGYMLQHIGEEYAALISGVVSFGFFVELEDLYVDGLVHISTLTDDFYRFMERKHLLVGERTGKRFKIGDEVRVLVERVNAITKRIDFRLVAVGGEARRGS
jgi:ribonuclease R